jgi:hypothetical protein
LHLTEPNTLARREGGWLEIVWPRAVIDTVAMALSVTSIAPGSSPTPTDSSARWRGLRWSCNYKQLRKGARWWRIWEWRWHLLTGEDSEGEEEEERAEWKTSTETQFFTSSACTSDVVVLHACTGSHTMLSLWHRSAMKAPENFEFKF